MRRQRGFSLIELMVALAILSITVVYLLETFTVNQRAYTVLDKTVETQQNLRAVADLIERDLRHAGMMIPWEAGLCGVDNTAGPDVLYISDYTAVDPGTDMAGYSGAQITSGAVGGGDNVSAGSNTLGLSSLVLEPAPARPAYDADGNGTRDSDYQQNGGVIVVDRNNPTRGVACGRVTAVNVGGTAVTVTLDDDLAALGGGVANLAVVPAIEYRIDSGRLLRNGLMLARGIEDLQIAYLFDLNSDGDVVEPTEVRGGNGTTGYTASAQSMRLLREVRLNFVARTRQETREFTAGQFVATENRTAVAGNDGFHRRVHRSSIMPRNMVNRMEGT